MNDENYEDQIIDYEDIRCYSSEWLSIGRVQGNYYGCITYGLNDNIELGIRRAPGTLKVESDCLNNKDYPLSSNIWWYCKKDIDKDLIAQNLSVEDLIEKLTDGLNEVLTIMSCEL